MNASVDSPATFVAIVDPCQEVRQQLQWILHGPEFNVFTFHSAEQFLREVDLFRECVVICEASLTGMSGQNLAQMLKDRGSPIPVALMSDINDISAVVELMKSGIADYLQKPVGRARLLEAAAGLNSKMKNSFKQYQTARTCGEYLSRLTPRETEVLLNMSNGLENRRIADLLQISIKTVEAHRMSIMQKLEARCMADVVKIALGTGDVRPPRLAWTSFRKTNPARRDRPAPDSGSRLGDQRPTTHQTASHAKRHDGKAECSSTCE